MTRRAPRTDTDGAALTAEMLGAVERELRGVVEDLAPEGTGQLAEMVRHHFGWDGGEPSGKRLRPLLTLLCAAGSGGDWRAALPAAASVELVHNFTLIHDDIEDSSETRRGRPTVWARWGVAQAINTGDFLFVAAHYACRRLLDRGLASATAYEAQRILDDACLRLTRGQHLDLAFEQRTRVSTLEYLEMIGGKTAALLAAATSVGAFLGGADEARRAAFEQFGWTLGMAFQLLDDLLGIWGEPGLTGKAAGDDLRHGKKSFPVVWGLEKSSDFAEQWTSRPRDEASVALLERALQACGAESATRQRAAGYTDQAMDALRRASPRGPAAEELEDLARRLLLRNR